MTYVDVHTHLTHEAFEADLDEVIQNAHQAGLEAIVVNGLETKSNRQILDMAKKYKIIWPALGIYPTYAASPVLQPGDLPWELDDFDLESELEFINQAASHKSICAIGECGLDGYWLKKETFSQQEQVFDRLIQIAISHDLPLIIHTRKLEKRAIEILHNHSPNKVIFHCYGGKSKLAIQTAEQTGWHFSIPANAHRSESFQKLLRNLPLECILTETDAPYLPPEKFSRNEPKNVVSTVALMASIRGMNQENARSVIWDNFSKIFNRPE